VTVTPGLEEALVDELAELGVRGQREVGGLEFEGPLALGWRVCLASRVAGRVLLRLGSFKAQHLEGLASGVRNLDWARFLHPHQPLEVAVTAHQSRLMHRETVAKKVSFAVQDALRGPRLSGPKPPREPARLVVRLVEDRATVSLDASGELLHRRGWRTQAGAAPLRENLAAAVLRLAGWGPGEPLVDPMCGAGTFLIEAGQITSGQLAGSARGFAFERWPQHEEKAFERERARLLPARAGKGASLLGNDLSASVVEVAKANARRAGLADRVTWSVGPADRLRPPQERGLLVVNPPYGQRLSPGRAADPLRAWGASLRRSWSGWRLAILLPQARLAAALGWRGEEKAVFLNGGLRVRLLVGPIGDAEQGPEEA
jgi:putative N6-adenine-specific DNA methylase